MNNEKIKYVPYKVLNELLTLFMCRMIEDDELYKRLEDETREW